jgi:hypothetical protein
MSALRRDLLERKLWIVVALLVACVVAVPLLLLKGAPAGGATTPAAPPATTPRQTTTASTQTTPSNEPAKVVLARIARDPFASAVPKLSSKPAAQTSPSSPTVSSPSTPTTASATTTSPSMVSPSPATTGTAGSSAPPTPVSTTPTSTVASVPTQTATPATPRSWTVYSVSLRYGKDLSVPLKSDVARLTPLPNVVQPQVMFMGVMADGKSAVFALHSGLGHTGPGLCRPDHLRCSAIVLRAGQTEHLTISTATGAHRQVVLRVVKISSSITHSRTVALAAYHHVSAAGQCELDLANPVSYDSATGTISSVTRSACEKHPNAVPFAYLVTAP